MAKRSTRQSTPAAYNPPPEVRFDVEDGFITLLPAVKKSVRLEVSGTLSKVALKEYGGKDCVVVRNPKIKVLKA